MRNINEIRDLARRFPALLARPAVVFYTLPPLMAILIAGTLAQRYLGLYEAQKTYFSSFILWAGPLPLPGGFTLAALLCLCLLVKFLFFSVWRWQKAGINLAHLGVIVLLLGGFVTALRAEEGFIVIPEGGRSSTISDYHAREFMIVQNGQIVGIVPFGNIGAGDVVGIAGTDLRLTVLSSCRNCAIKKREDVAAESEAPLRDLAQFMALVATPPELENEANLNGATMLLSGAGEDQDGFYIFFEAMPRPAKVSVSGGAYEIILGKQQRTLPFGLKLDNFEKDTHPGTAMASAYHSDVVIEDGGTSWPVRIEMNKPLRYRGYTFFQSSFAESEDGTATILSVVRNEGWLFPYIGTLIIAAGLLLQVFIAARRRKEKI